MEFFLVNTSKMMEFLLVEECLQSFFWGEYNSFVRCFVPEISTDDDKKYSPKSVWIQESVLLDTKHNTQQSLLCCSNSNNQTVFRFAHIKDKLLIEFS